MTDWTQILARLDPNQDGEQPVRHRSAVVDSVNANGTVDLDFDGTVIPDVSVLAGAYLFVGATVQVAVWRGDMLVLGSTRTANSGGALGEIAYAEVTANQGSITTFAALTGLSATLTIPAGRRVIVTGQIQVQVNTVSDTTAQLAVTEDTVVLQSARNRPVGNNRAATLMVQHNFTSDGSPHTYGLSLRREVGTGTLTMVADNVNRAFIRIDDNGAA